MARRKVNHDEVQQLVDDVVAKLGMDDVRIEADLGTPGFVDRLDKRLDADEAARPQVPKRVWDSETRELFVRVLISGRLAYYVQWKRGRALSLGKHPGLTVASARLQARAALVSSHEAKDGMPEQLRERRERNKAAAGTVLTVADAGRAYVKQLRKDKRTKTARDVELRFARVLDQDPLGRVALAELHQDHIDAWRDRLESGKRPTLPSRKGRPPAAGAMSPATFKRNLATLKAALNLAVEKRHVSPDKAREWASVKPERGADGVRDLYLDRDERRALLNHARPDLRDVMECILLTGCRPGDPVAALRRDYQVHAGAVTFRTKNHERTIPLSARAVQLFDRVAKGKLPMAPLFSQEGGRPWSSKDLSDAVRAAAEAAGSPDGVVLYTLRHCWITDQIIGGMDPLTVAKLSGTSLAMIEKTYGHLVPDAARDRLGKVQMF